MFKSGLFSSDPAQPTQVDAKGLKLLTMDQLAKGLQVTDTNPLAGLEGRTGLLTKLGDALLNQRFFGETSRPGNMLGKFPRRRTLWLSLTNADYLLSHETTLASSIPIVALPVLWEVLMDGLGPIWPATRNTIDGVSLGDAWPCDAMPSTQYNQPWEQIVPFHKLTQWLAYSLMTPMAKLLHIHFAGAELLTGLPEYRNGGLFVDTGLLTLKADDMARGIKQFKDNAAVKGQPNMEVVPLFTVDDDVIVEWRAVTVGFLDLLLDEVNGQLGLGGNEALTLPQMLEAGSWKVSAGRIHAPNDVARC